MSVHTEVLHRSLLVICLCFSVSVSVFLSVHVVNDFLCCVVFRMGVLLAGCIMLSCGMHHSVHLVMQRI